MRNSQRRYEGGGEEKGKRSRGRLPEIRTVLVLKKEKAEEKERERSDGTAFECIKMKREIRTQQPK